jgi:glycosyltransferase involved in cell wall biosynthesis
LLFHLWRALKLVFSAEKHAYDILWLRGERFPLFYLACKQFFPFRCVYEFHEIGYLNHVPEQELLATQPRFDVARWIYRKADGIIVISETLRQLMTAKWGRKTPLTVIPSGATLFEIAPLPPTKALRDIYFVGNYYYFSGLDVAIRALALLPDVTLHIVGGGGSGDPDYDRIQALVTALQLDQRVVFHGFVAPHALPALFALADMLIMPHTGAIRAKYFVSPLKLFQYMSANRPIIASDLPTVREIVSDGTDALLVPPENPIALAAAIERLLRDGDLARTIAANAKIKSRNYSMEKRARQMIDFFEQPANDAAEFAFLEGKLLSGRVYPEFFRFRPKTCVLNVGCGLGPQAIAYAGQYANMIGIDINGERLALSQHAVVARGIDNYTTLQANVENIPLPDAAFDYAIAIDIAEHVEDPVQLCRELNRLLTAQGELLITFPAMHDFYTGLAHRIGRILFNKTPKSEPHNWDPDWHNQRMPIADWIDLVEGCGFKLRQRRASTLFPPLHLYGVPRFWFSNETIHTIDSALCRQPFLQRFGQTLVCVFEKIS